MGIKIAPGNADANPMAVNAYHEITYVNRRLSGMFRATESDIKRNIGIFWGRHRQKFKGNRRMGRQLNNLDRKDDGERRAIKKRADGLKRYRHLNDAPRVLFLP